MTDYAKNEQARLQLQRRLNDGKSQAERNRLGQFPTPSHLASDIVTTAVSLLPPKSKIRYLEPGFGTGPFYSALLSHVSKSRIRKASGYEIDPHYGIPASQFWMDANVQIATDDFTKAQPPEADVDKYNLVVCNPPYVRHHHLSREQKRDLAAAVTRYIHFGNNGLSGLYTYFLILSQGWMSAGGVGAWLIPSEFMDVNYGRVVKDFLLNRITLLRIHRFDPDEVQFDDALVSSAVLLLRNTPPAADHAVEFSFGGTLAEPKRSKLMPRADLEQISKWTSLPHRNGRLSVKTNGQTLSSLFTIKRGLATGCNSFFVVTPELAEKHQIPKRFLQPILPSPRDLEANEIQANKLGEPLIKKRRYLINCDLTEDEIARQHPALWEYLESGKTQEIDKRYLCRHREPWYVQEKRPAAPFLCTYMGRTTKRSDCPFRFILNHSNATAANVYLLLYPKPILAQWLAEDTSRYKAMWNTLSSITAEMLMGEGRVYGGGLYKMEPKELGNVDVEWIVNRLPQSENLRQDWQNELF